MSQHQTQSEPADRLPDGMLEYALRTDIRDYIRRYGFDDARSVVAAILNDEADRSRRHAPLA